MNQYPKITIITPSFNQGEYIEKTIQSVLNQNYPNLQYIIIDGASTDNTVEIIKKYASKIDYWVSEKDRGQSDAINKGLKMATGEIINWLNSDDMLTEGALHNLARVVNENPDANVFTGQTTYLLNGKVHNPKSNTVFANREITFGFGHVNQPSTYYRKSVIDEIGMLDEKLHYCMDLDWWLKYLLRYDISTVVAVDDIWSVFRMHNESKTILGAVNFQKEKRMIYDRIFTFYSSGEAGKTKLPFTTNLNLSSAKNYYNLWQSDVNALDNHKLLSFKHWIKVNPLKILPVEKRRYLGVLKNLIFKW